MALRLQPNQLCTIPVGTYMRISVYRPEHQAKLLRLMEHTGAINPTRVVEQLIEEAAMRLDSLESGTNVTKQDQEEQHP